MATAILTMEIDPDKANRPNHAYPRNVPDQLNAPL